MYQGWIKIHRAIQDHPLWKCEPFTRGQAWIDLILLANHKESFFYKRNVKINVNRGQVGRSEVELSDRWKWSRSKVRKFLNDLEKEQQVIQHKTNVTQLLTIINYEEYQGKEQQDEQQKDTKKTPKEQQKNTYKNVKKEKKEKNDNKIKIPTYEDFEIYVLEKEPLIDLKSLKHKYDSWIENDWKTGKDKKITNWKTTILNTLQYLPTNEKGKKGFQDNQGSYAGSKTTILPSDSPKSTW